MEIQKGEWYFSLQCKGCDAIIYFSHDPSRGKAELAAREYSVLNLTCPGCQAVNDYDQSELFSREAKYV
jgi:hypothetical protein